MVKLSKVRTVKSTTADEVAHMSSPTNKIPNRFRSKHYDRSVFGGDDCVKMFQKCSCYQCGTAPMVVVSSGERVCDKYNITLRTVKEHMDGGMLEPLQEETFLIYAQKTSSGKYQIGILAGLDVDDCKANIIKKHELCVPQAEANRSQKVKLFQSLYVDPIMVMYRQNARIDSLVSKVMASAEPITLHSAHDASDAEHLLWSVKDPGDLHALQDAFEHIDSMYIADGHHRTSAACKAQTASRKWPPSGRYLTALIFPDTQLNVLSYNRCLKSLGVLDTPTFLETLAKSFNIHALAEDTVQSTYAQSDRGIMMYLDKKWYLLAMKAHIQDVYRGNPLGGIDAQVLSDQVMTPMLGLAYPDGEKQVEYIDGRSGWEGVQRSVDQGDAAVGFALTRVTTEKIMQVADANLLLPPKATFFDPKPMPGLLLRLQR